VATANDHKCAVCNAKVSIPETGSTSNITAHYKTAHPAVHTAHEAAVGNKVEQKNVIVAALDKAQKAKAKAKEAIQGHVKPVPPEASCVANKDLVRRVAGVVLVAVQQLPFELLGSEVLEAFVNAAGGYIDSSKKTYVVVLPEVYDVVNDFLREETAEVRAGSVTYDGWSDKSGAPVAGLTFNFVNADWNLVAMPVSFFDTGDAVKDGPGHKRILEAALTDNPRLGDDVLIYSGVTDNEPAPALGMDLYLNFGGALRCNDHSLALVVIHAADESVYLNKLVAQVAAITTYVNKHPKIGRQLYAVQLEERPADRIMLLEKLIHTRWHNKLVILEKHIILAPELSKVLPSDAPPVLNKYQLGVAAEMVVVLKEVRRVARSFESDREVSGAGVPRRLWCLEQTMRLLGGGSIAAGQALGAGADDAAIAAARAQKLGFKEAKVLASKIADGITERLGHLYEQVPMDFFLLDFDEMDEEEKKAHRKWRQAATYQMCALFDVNECVLEFVPAAERAAYYKVLYAGVEKELPTLLRKYKEGRNYVSWIEGMHNAVLRSHAHDGRGGPERPLLWWRELSKKGLDEIVDEPDLVEAARLTDVARCFLSVQASSASAERMFSDAGHGNTHQRQSMPMYTLEMLLVIRAFVKRRVEAAAQQAVSVAQTDLHSARSAHVLVVVRQIANAVATKQRAQAQAAR